ncbi:MAG: proliferating cell nuclear antigen (pcna) [Candidatus Aenigmarchaeota archaeon]|nr:proliferating cell nuclear antigen (pcna) [Candidatus Aenigmarchaeota archaeon]
MFSARLDNIDMLRDSIATIAEFIDETQLQIKEKGIEMVAADRAVVVVVDFAISRSVFNEYHHEQDEKIGVNLQNFLQILKRAAPEDKMLIKLDNNKFHITFEGTSTRHFILPLIDTSRDETPPLDKLEFKTFLKVNADLLSSGIEDAELVTDSVVLTVRKDMLTMKAESDSTSTQMEVPSGTDSLKIIDITEPVRARYSLDYLKKIIKAKKLSSEANIAMSTDYPMKIEFDVPGKMRLGFILAPRVED